MPGNANLIEFWMEASEESFVQSSYSNNVGGAWNRLVPKLLSKHTQRDCITSRVGGEVTDVLQSAVFSCFPTYSNFNRGRYKKIP